MKTKIKPSPIILLVIALGILASLTAGCQTTKGFGKDVEHVGEKIQGH